MNTSDKLVIEARGLEKRYNTRRALRGVDLAVERGEIFGFLGPNGAGKTTAIRCCLDLIRPTSGTLRVLGMDPQADPVGVRSRTGYLPGELRLDERRSVRQTLAYFTRLRADSRGARPDQDTVRERALSYAERLGLELDVRVGALSKGNKQKVGIVQALMHEPELLILDEPTSGLDPLVQHEVLTMVRDARDRGATVFFSSHQLSEVQAIAQRVGMIREGVVVDVAETHALVNRSFRRVTLVLREPVDEHGLADVEGVRVLARRDGDGAREVRVEVTGDMGPLVAQMARLPVVDFQTENPSLEEIFRSYYTGQAQHDDDDDDAGAAS